MSCKFDKEIIQKYIDNTIDPLEFVFLQEHLRYCTYCKAELDVLSAADRELFGFFETEIQSAELDKLLESVVDQCMEEAGKLSLRYKLVKGVEISRSLVRSTATFVNYIPGTRLVRKGMRQGAAQLGKGMKTLISREVKKVFAG